MQSSRLLFPLTLSSGLPAVGAGGIFAQDHDHTRFANTSGTDWLHRSGLLKPDRVPPGEKPRVSAEVHTVDMSGNEITISQKATAGIAMPAMTTRFPVQDPAHLRRVEPGDRFQM